MNPDDIDNMEDEEVRELLRKIVTSLNLAEDEGAFGVESWRGFLEIEV